MLRGIAEEGYLGYGVNALWIQCWIRLRRRPERERRGQPALFHRDRRQAGEPDHVAHRADVGLLGALLRIHRDAAEEIGFDDIRGKADRIHITRPPHLIHAHLPLYPTLS